MAGVNLQNETTAVIRTFFFFQRSWHWITDAVGVITNPEATLIKTTAWYCESHNAD